jgi:DNA-directed RNA polymerase subunit H (RpoH/RPB5)
MMRHQICSVLVGGDVVEVIRVSETTGRVQNTA